jgi:L-fuconolactonase
MIVDGHAHVWALDPATYPWQPTFGFVPTEAATPDELQAAMDRHGVGHAVLVQPSAYGPDHRFLLETVRRQPGRFLAIGLVDPSDPADTAAATSLVREKSCVGLRVNLALDLRRAAEQADGAGWAGLDALGAPICLRATPAHHELAKAILGRHRGIRVVIDHMGLPEPDRLAEAAGRLAELAAFEHCWLKVAGLARFSRSGPPYRDTWPVVRAALRSFGSSRLTWGSDFPSGDGAAGYRAAIEAIESMPFFSASDRQRLLSGTAHDLWGLPAPASTP